MSRTSRWVYLRMMWYRWSTVRPTCGNSIGRDSCTAPIQGIPSSATTSSRLSLSRKMWNLSTCLLCFPRAPSPTPPSGTASGNSLLIQIEEDLFVGQLSRFLWFLQQHPGWGLSQAAQYLHRQGAHALPGDVQQDLRRKDHFFFAEWDCGGGWGCSVGIGGGWGSDSSVRIFYA